MQKGCSFTLLFIGFLVSQAGYGHSIDQGKNAALLQSVHLPSPRSSLLSGLSVDKEGNILVTARDFVIKKENGLFEKTGRLYFARSGEKEGSLVDIRSPEGVTYGNFFGQDIIKRGRIIYICSNPTINTVAPSVIVLKKNSPSQFEWLYSANFSHPGEFCRHIVRYGKSYILASNSRPRGHLKTTAVYAMKMNHTFPQELLPVASYRDLNYTEKTIKERNASLIGLATIKKDPNKIRVAASGLPGPWFSIYDSPNTEPKFYHNSAGPFLVIKKIPADKITSVRFLRPNVVIAVAYEKKGNTSFLWQENIRKTEGKKLTLIQTPSPALVIKKRDPFGKTENNVAFVLNNQYSNGGYSIDEYDIG